MRDRFVSGNYEIEYIGAKRIFVHLIPRKKK